MKKNGSGTNSMSGGGFRIPLFYLVTGFYWISMYSYTSTLSTYSKSLGASYGMVGMIVGSYGLTQMLCRIPLGIFSDRVNRRKLFVCAGLGISLLSAAGLALFHTPLAVFLFRALSGVAASAWVSYTVLFASYFGREKTARAIGTINAVNNAGMMAGIFIGGIAAQWFGQNAPFVFAAGISLIGFFMSLFVVENAPKGGTSPSLRALLSIFRDRNFLLVSLLAIIIQFLQFATVYGFTPIVAQSVGASAFEIGVLTTLFTLPGIFASVLSGTVLAERFGEKRVIFFGLLLTTVFCVAAPLSPDIWVLFAFQILAGFGFGCTFPLLMVMSVKNVASEKRSTAMGFFQAVYGIGMFLGPIVVGVLSEHVGLGPGYLVIGLVGLAGVCLALFYREPGAAAGSRPEAKTPPAKTRVQK